MPSFSAPPQRLTDRKRQAIIEAAIDEFRTAGYETTSMDRIAARAEVSKRTIYNHFPSKEVLFAEILHHYGKRSPEAKTLRIAPIVRCAINCWN
jgi:TetR/AcrR family transcriptional regulator of autoinduction and epiphytic fitness